MVVGLKNLLSIRPETSGQVADCLDLYAQYIPGPGRRMVERADGPPLPYTVDIKKGLIGPNFKIPRQVAYFGLGYAAAHGFELKVGGILRFNAVNVAERAERQCALVVSDFTHEAIGGAVMDLMQGKTAFDQAEQLLRTGEVYPLDITDPCGLAELSQPEREAFKARLREVTAALHQNMLSGRSPWFGP